jgi:hypothetical protein
MFKNVPFYAFRIITSVLLLLIFIPTKALTELYNNKKKETLIKSIPVKFLENKGQLLDDRGKPADYVWFKGGSNGVDVYITEFGLTYIFTKYEEKEDEKENEKEKENIKMKWERIDMKLKGASLKKENIIKEGESITDNNFFLGHCPNGIMHAKQYDKIIIKNVYPGIDWVLYNADARGFKYDFIVHPGANPDQVELEYTSLKQLKTNDNGGLVMQTDLGRLEEGAPFAYLKESKKGVTCGFELLTKINKGKLHTTTFGFLMNDSYNKTETLIIDPQLTWSTFYGGGSFEGTISLDSDPSGNLVMHGYTASTNLPTLNNGGYFQGTWAMSVQTEFILKFDNAGVLLWATYFGTTVSNIGSIKFDNGGNVFMVGQTTSTNFPVVNAGSYFQGTSTGTDAFILKFDGSSNILWSTYYGGSGADYANALDIDNSGNVFITGITTSTNFPVQNASTYFLSTLPTGATLSGYMLKFDNSGNRLWATYVPYISATAITTDNTGNVFVGGNTTSTAIPVLNPGGGAYFQAVPTGSNDAFLLKFTNTGNLLWSTYFGGSGNELSISLISDDNGNVFMSGSTTSTNLPVHNAGTYFQSALATTTNAALAADIYITKFSGSGVCQWSTYFGGNGNDLHTAQDCLAMDSCGNLYIGFESMSTNLPLQQSCDGGFIDSMNTEGIYYRDIYVASFTNSGSLRWATYLGGDGNDFRASLATDSHDHLYITGEWANCTLNSSYSWINPGGSTYFDSTANGSDDVYIVRFKFTQTNYSFLYPQQICGNIGNISPTVSTGFIYGGNFVSQTGLSLNPLSGQINLTLSTPGTYTVNYLWPGGPGCNCVAQGGIQSSAIVSIVSLPTISISGNNTICVGAQASFTASGAYTFTWSTGSNSGTLKIKPTQTTTYTVTGKGAKNCTATKTIQVVVLPCTGIETQQIESDVIKIFPNPNKGEFKIESEKDVSLTIVNELGQHIRKIKLSAQNDRKIVISDFAAGIYFIIDDKKQQSIKVVVDK